MKSNKKLLFSSILLTSFLPFSIVSCVQKGKNNDEVKKQELSIKIDAKISELNTLDKQTSEPKYSQVNAEIKAELAKHNNKSLKDLTVKDLTRIFSNLTVFIATVYQKIKTINDLKPELGDQTNPKKGNDNGSQTPPTPPKEGYDNIQIPPTDKPELPVWPPTFPKIDNSSKHTYPEYASKFIKVDSNVLYNEIFDRTFALKFATKQENGGFISNDKGTGWLLDYYQYKSNPNKYKLFIATNLHVIGNFSNSLSDELNKKLNYEDPVKDKVVAVALGKAKNKPTQFSALPNNTANQEANKNEWIAKYYTNSNELVDYDKSEGVTDTIQSSAISAPKIVFAAYDFMKKESMQKYQADLQKNAEQWHKNLKNSGEIDEDYKKPMFDAYFKGNKHIGVMVDFAVFEVDVDLSSAPEELKQWVNNAIKGLDSYIDRLEKTDILPNQNKEISKYMLTTDYVSAAKNEKNENNLYNIQNIFIGGYPFGHKHGMWVINNPIERNSENITSYNRSPVNARTFALPADNHESKLEFGNNLLIYGNTWRKLMAQWYGYHHNINFSSLYYGASGSLVYNEFGQMIGIYDAVRANVNSGDLLQGGGFAPFIQSSDINGVTGDTLYAYNLIDGTDKSKFAHQSNSFRENLRIIYPNGFENGENTTKLFDKGF